MPDRDKVIKGLAHCTRPSEVSKGGNFCMDCPYTEPIGFNQFKCNGQQMMKDAIALLKEQEAVVRCKDCKHKEKDGISEGFHYCNVNGLQVTDAWFCADGERKSD